MIPVVINPTGSPQVVKLGEAIRISIERQGYFTVSKTPRGRPRMYTPEEQAAKHREYDRRYYHEVIKKDPVKCELNKQRKRESYHRIKETDPERHAAKIQRDRETKRRKREARGVPQRVFSTPEELRERRLERNRRYYLLHKDDPVWRARQNAMDRARRQALKQNDPVRYRAMLDRERDRKQRSMGEVAP